MLSLYYVFLKEESISEVSFFLQHGHSEPLATVGFLIRVQTEKASLCLTLRVPEDEIRACPVVITNLGVAMY